MADTDESAVPEPNDEQHHSQARPTVPDNSAQESSTFRGQSQSDPSHSGAIEGAKISAQGQRHGAMIGAIGAILAAVIGAVVVFFLTRPPADEFKITSHSNEQHVPKDLTDFTGTTSPLGSDKLWGFELNKDENGNDYYYYNKNIGKVEVNGDGTWRFQADLREAPDYMRLPVVFARGNRDCESLIDGLEPDKDRTRGFRHRLPDVCREIDRVIVVVDPSLRPTTP